VGGSILKRAKQNIEWTKTQNVSTKGGHISRKHYKMNDSPGAPSPATVNCLFNSLDETHSCIPLRKLLIAEKENFADL